MPGFLELLIIGLIGLVCLGVPVIIIVAVVVSSNRRQQQSTKCPNCGELLPPSNFCAHCGAKST